MEVKREQEDFHEKSVKIKQEPEFVDLQTPVKVEKHDSDIKNTQIPPSQHFPNIKVEPQDKAADNIDDIREVKASDYFVSNSDLVNINIKREPSELVDFKSELLTTHCDLPSLKSENDYFKEPCSSKQAQNILKRTKDKKSASGKAIKKKKKKFTCPICQKSFPTSTIRLNHLKEHFLKHYISCNICGKSCIKYTEFLLHLPLHFVKIKKPSNSVTAKLKDEKVENTEEYSNDCKICSKRFVYNYDLIYHMSTHNKRKPLKCEFCYKSFVFQSDLGYHTASEHGVNALMATNTCSNDISCVLKTHFDKKLYYCNLCPVKFNNLNQLTIHKRIIHGRKCEL